MRNHFLFLAGLALIVFSCNNDTTSNVDEQGSGASQGFIDTRPSAKGAPGEVFVVIDPAQWEDSLGKEIRRTFAISVPGLPQPEPMFTLRNVSPLDMTKTLREMKSLVYVATLDNDSRAGKRLNRNFTEASMEEIRNDPDKFQFIKTDEFAKGQKVVHLFGADEESLIQNIIDHREQLRNYFTKLEKDRLAATLLDVTETGIDTRLRNNYGCSLKLPRGYEIAQPEDDFIWIRRLDATLDVDRAIFIYREPYTDESVFTEEGLQALRDRITSKYIHDIQKPDIIMERQKELFLSKEVNFHGNYAMEVRGLWRLNDLSLGGPYISYAMVDQSTNQLYYIEGYVAAPGTEKRTYMMEMEVILDTFRLVKQNTTN